MLSLIKSQEDVRGLLLVFSEVWGAETLSELISSLEYTTCLLAKNEANGKVAGYIFYGRDRREDFIEITDIGVASYFRGKGYGKALVHAVCEVSDCVRLCVKEKNITAKCLYESIGFTVIQVIQNYYGIGEDGIRMEWKKPE